MYYHRSISLSQLGRDKVAEILLKNGAQIDAKLTDESDSTPLDLALKAGEFIREKNDFHHFCQ